MIRRSVPILCALAGVLPAYASQRAVVSDDLRAHPINTLLMLSDSGVEIEDDVSSVRRLNAGTLLGVTQTGKRAVSPTPGFGWIELVDGQRYVGRSAERASEDESIAWDHRDFGVLWIPLESVLRVSPAGESPARARENAPISDRVYLTNGDVLTGYLVRAGAEFAVETDSGELSVAPAGLVSLARLANPASDPEGVYLWTNDGSVFAAESVMDLTGERVQVVLRSGESAALEVSQILGVAFAAERYMPLASLEPHTTLPRSRRWSREASASPAPGGLDAPLLFAPDITIPGAMTLRWSLPRGAVRFGATAVMPPSAFPWGDCEVVVRSGGDIVQRARLNEESPSVEINVDLVSADLQIEVLSGANGDVHDEVTLIAPLILLDER